MAVRIVFGGRGRRYVNLFSNSFAIGTVKLWDRNSVVEKLRERSDRRGQKRLLILGLERSLYTSHKGINKS